ncbi:PEP-CTERM sorting domain-containing protein [Duganella fentianensis]|uniref:PEP-CTERM sorting domain-containing protein n=1 Tax=Duganella fentianensis TaxID=2692177 RepID=UPI001E2CFB89|nr:PEP-CTERM sorting domain-containing protein [Duganella fentianensis]
MPSFLKTSLSLGLLALSLNAHAGKITIDFDDYGASVYSGYIIDTRYAGLDWSNFGVIEGNSIPNSGYVWGTVSGKYAAFNSRGDDASFSSGSDKNFTLYDLLLTAAWRDSTVEFYGYDNGQLKKTLSVNTSATTPVLVHFNWSNIDAVRLHVVSKNYGAQQVVDNIKLEFTAPLPVPEPETYAMLLAGLGLIGFARRHKASLRA